MKEIITTNNTFYVKKVVKDDIGVIPTFPDAYVGSTANFNIKSNPDTSFYLAENNTVSTNDFVYGEGSIKEIYLSLYVNSLSQMNPQTANWLDIFSIKPNINIVEGNMTIASGNTTVYGDEPILLYNTYNMDKATFSEDFDGINKAFLDVESTPKRVLGLKTTSRLYMSAVDLRRLAYKEDWVYQANPDQHGGWGKSNRAEEWDQLVNWTGYQVGRGLTWLAQGAAKGWRWMSAKDEGYETSFEDGMVGVIDKQADGNYRLSQSQSEAWTPGSWGFAKRLDKLVKPRDWWISQGAWEDEDIVIPGLGALPAYDQFDESFISRCTQLNSIFSSVYSSPDVRDIKDQTLEGPGDSDRFISYAYANLVRAESPTDNVCLRMKAFWENYSGSYNGIIPINTANPFGHHNAANINDKAYPQVVQASILGIPQPTPIDVTTSGTGFPAYSPEIEVVMKINDMGLATFGNSGYGSGDWASGSGANTLDRSFNIIFNDNYNSMEENTNLLDSCTYWMLNSATATYGTRFSPWITFINEDPSSGEIQVYTNQNCLKRNYGGVTYGRARNLVVDGPVDDDIYQTTVPMGEWFTMRIKLNMYSQVSYQEGAILEITGSYTGGDNDNGSYNNLQISSSYTLMKGNPTTNARFDVTLADPVITVTPTTGYEGIGYKVGDEIRILGGETGGSDGTDDILCVVKAAGVNPSLAYAPASGGASLVYFPDLLDSDGQVKYSVLAHGSPWGENLWAPDGSGATVGAYSMSGNNAHYPNMTFWMQNMRAINQVPATFDTTDINNGFTKIDDIPSDDKTVDILIDSINFRNWGPEITNATICNENGMGLMTKIPAGNFVTPSIYPGGDTIVSSGAVSVNPNGTTVEPVDNYYTKSSAITASYASFGFESSGLSTQNAISGHEKFLMNSFSVGAEATAQGLTLVSGGYFTSGNYLGTFGHNYQNNWFNNLTVGDSTKNIQTTGGAGSVDNFVQKGTIGISGTFTTTGSGPWVRTGNPLCAAKIMSRGSDNMSIVVDNPELFDIPLNTPLVVELNNTDYAHKSVGSGSIGYYSSLPASNQYYNVPLVQTRKREGSKIFLSRAVKFCDAQVPGTDAIVDTGYGAFDFMWSPVRGTGYTSAATAKYYATNYNLTKATISPYKYWINLALLNVSSSAGWGNSFADTTHSGTKLLQTRVYDGIVGVSGGTTLGTTYNEHLFNDGIYANKWDISFFDPTNTIVDLNTDYGYGIINDNSNDDTVPDSDGGIGRIGRDYVVSGQNYINLGSYAYTIKPRFNDSFNFIIKPTYMNLFDSLYSCNVNTKEATSDKMQLIYGIVDPIPEVDDFTVTPSLDLSRIGEDPVAIANATKANATDLMFSWKESGDDINHRILWVDTAAIQNKYHKANFIAPLNENSSTVNYYTSAANYIKETAVALTGTNLPNIEGACGYAFGGNGTSTGVSSSTGVALGSGDEFTFACQIKPNVKHTGKIFMASSSAVTEDDIFDCYLESDGTIKLSVNNAANLQTDTIYDCDGKQPLAIVVTYKKSSNNNNIKLYVNDKLEDTADYSSTFSGTSHNTVSIGCKVDDGSVEFNGTIDEITFHSKCAYVPTNANKFMLKTLELPDLTSGSSNKYQARLFLYDYHNIRGASPQDVCRSNAASWKLTGLT